jgi:eukaryotic-like serine/threonine-protein kinase
MSDNDQPDLLPAGHRIAGHVVTRLLGRGAMGDVYEVVHEETGESYALKLLNEEMRERASMVERFRKEAEVMSVLDHPHIAKVDASGLEGKRHWLRVELLGVQERGEEITTLGDYIRYRGGRLPQQEVLECLRQFLDALRYAHGRGIIHRDLKPANILMHAGGMKIADFGIVAAVGEEWLRTQVEKTVASTIAMGGKVNGLDLGTVGNASGETSLIGTFAYMSPEQKECLPATVQSDIYSLGLICFHMLTGHKEPRFKLPSRIHDGLDPSWDKFILGTLEKEPSARHADAGAALEALEKVAEAMKASSGASAAQSVQPRQPDRGEQLPREIPVAATQGKPLRAKRQRVRPIVSRPKSPVRLILATVLIFAVVLWLLKFWNAPEYVGTAVDKLNLSRPPYTVHSLGMEMLWCKPGKFQMGSPASEKDRRDKEIRHKVILTRGFYLGKYEVTQAQWEKVMVFNPSNFRGSSLPVEKVSWNDAMKFCEKLTQMEKAVGRLPTGHVYTLPTEAQWEYACRAGTATAYSFGDTITPKQANYGKNVDKTAVVGTYPANTWGFHDMHGNVWEWCRDWFGDYSNGIARDPVGPSIAPLRASRGGSWVYNVKDMGSAYRSGNSPRTLSYGLGFRLSLQVE